jgi:hypothetical protein
MTEDLPSEDDGPEKEKAKSTGGRNPPPKMTPDQIAEMVQRTIDEAIKRNTPHEIAILVILVSVAFVGIFLLLSGAADRRWELLASGSSCALAVGWPVSRLFGMWKFNLALKTLPAVMRMSDNKSRQELLFRFVDRLIARL